MKRFPAPALPGWLDEMLPFTRYRVDVGEGLQMHVMEQGEGRPVLLFHGNPTWGFLYRKVAQRLADEKLRLIMPDLIGLGFSDRPPARGDHSLDNHSRWMARLLESLELDDAVAVVQDWGGPIGLHAFSRRPGTLTGLVVMNTSLTKPKPGFKPTLFHRVFSTWVGDMMNRYLGLPQRVLSIAQGDGSSISGQISKAYVYPLGRGRGREAVTALVRMVPSDMEHPTVAGLGVVEELAEGFQGRSAIVWGDKDPVLGRLRRRHERLLPRARVIPTQAGHFLQEEVPDEIADAIRHVAD